MVFFFSLDSGLGGQKLAGHWALFDPIMAEGLLFIIHN